MFFCIFLVVSFGFRGQGFFFFFFFLLTAVLALGGGEAPITDTGVTGGPLWTVSSGVASATAAAAVTQAVLGHILEDAVYTVCRQTQGEEEEEEVSR